MGEVITSKGVQVSPKTVNITTGVEVDDAVIIENNIEEIDGVIQEIHITNSGRVEKIKIKTGKKYGSVFVTENGEVISDEEEFVTNAHVRHP